MDIPLTDHARQRLQQRAISEPVVAGLLAYGRGEHDHRGSTLFYFDHRARARLRNVWDKETYRRLEQKLDAYLVVAADGSVITAGHRTRRINRH